MRYECGNATTDQAHTQLVERGRRFATQPRYKKYAQATRRTEAALGQQAAGNSLAAASHPAQKRAVRAAPAGAGSLRGAATAPGGARTGARARKRDVAVAVPADCAPPVAASQRQRLDSGAGARDETAAGCRPQRTRVRKLCEDFCYDEVQGGAATSPAAAVTDSRKRARGDASVDGDWCAERELAIAGDGSEDDFDADMDDVPAQQQPGPGGSGATPAAQSKPGRSKPATVSNKARRACSYVGKGKCL